MPALRSVSTAFSITSFVRSAAINAVDALSTLLTIFSSWMVALPVAPPPPSDGSRLHAPRPAQDLDLALVRVVLRFAFDHAVLGAFDTEKHVAGAGRTSRRVVRHCRCHVMNPEAALTFLLGLDVVLEVNAGVERPVRLLRLVLDSRPWRTPARRSPTCRAVAALPPCVTLGDDDVVHLDDQEFLLALAGLALGDRRFLDVLAGRARLHQHRRRLVDVSA